MDYFNLFNLTREPFSNSPDPDFFYHSSGHRECLQQLEIAIRLRRGLNVVIGDIGIGKTTLCRQLIRQLAGSPEIETHLVLDPHFHSSREFLFTVAGFFGIADLAENSTELQAKERIKQALFEKGVQDNRIVTLLIDEGQKVPRHCLEILREFLNFETNASKLLQIVIFAQREFADQIATQPNFTDRINLFFELKPLSLKETHELIRFRLAQAHPEKAFMKRLFTYPALWAVHRATGGYPRKIINLCHRIFLAMIIQNKVRADFALVRSCAAHYLPGGLSRRHLGWGSLLVVLTVLAVFFGLNFLPSGFKPGESHTPPRELAAAGKDLPDDASSGSGCRDTDGEPAAQTGEVCAAVSKTPSPAEGQTEPGDSRPAAVATTASELPATLGTLSINTGETVSELIRKVLGTYQHHFLRRVLEANPHLKRLNQVQTGDPLFFPAVPVTIRPGEAPLWWIRIAETDELEKAMQYVRDYPDKRPVIRILPLWSAKSGLRFVVYADILFREKRRAEHNLPLLAYFENAAVARYPDWDPGTVLFADPLVNCRIQ